MVGYYRPCKFLRSCMYLTVTVKGKGIKRAGGDNTNVLTSTSTVPAKETAMQAEAEVSCNISCANDVHEPLQSTPTGIIRTIALCGLPSLSFVPPIPSFLPSSLPFYPPASRGSELVSYHDNNNNKSQSHPIYWSILRRDGKIAKQAQQTHRPI